MKRLLAGALLSAGVLGGVAAPASAAPPQTFEYEDECYTEAYEGDEHTYCFGGSTTYKVNQKSGDTYSGMYKSTFRSTSYVNGVLEGTSSSTSQTKFKVREGMQTKYFARYQGTNDFGGQECTYSASFKIMKGVVTTDTYESDCDPFV